MRLVRRLQHTVIKVVVDLFGSMDGSALLYLYKVSAGFRLMYSINNINKTIIIMVKQNLLTKLLLLFALIVGSTSVWADDVTTSISGSSMLEGTSPSTSYNDHTTGITDDHNYVYTGRWTYQKNGSTYMNMIQIKKVESSNTSRIVLPKFDGTIKSITLTVTNASATASDGDGAKTRLSIVNGTGYSSAEANSNSIFTLGSSSSATQSYVFDFTTLEDSYNGEGLYICSRDAAARIWAIEVVYEESNLTNTTTTIDASGITNTDLYVGTSAGQLIATVKAGDDVIKNAPVIWSSSATSVATVDTEGNVTLKAVGTTTIKATYAGNDTYGSSSATYNLKVDYNDPNSLTATFEFSANKYGWEATSNGNTYFDGSDYNATEGHITIGFSGKVRLWVSNDYYTMRFYNDDTYGRGKMALTADEGYVITGVSIFGSTLSFQNPSSGSIDEGEWTGNAKVLTIEKGSSTSTFTTVKVTYKRETVTITPASGLDYISFSSTKALDFTDVEGLTAFVVSADGTSSVTLSPVMKVPANTGLVLKKTGEEDRYDVTVLSGDADTFTNLLVGAADGPKLVQPREVYVLNGGKFKLFTGTEIPQGKAYLPATTGAPALDLDFGEGTTGIQNIERTVNDNQYYTLDGRRVAQPTKGLYIVNGKKVIIK